MMKLIIIGIVIFAINACSTFLELDKPLLGTYSIKEWVENAAWKDYSAASYQPDMGKIEFLKMRLAEDKYDFLIFASSHCDECRENLPIILKILREAQANEEQISITGLDESLEEPSDSQDEYGIKIVPTLIIKSKSGYSKIEYPAGDWLDKILNTLN